MWGIYWVTSCIKYIMVCIREYLNKIVVKKSSGVGFDKSNDYGKQKKFAKS